MEGGDGEGRCEGGRVGGEGDEDMYPEYINAIVLAHTQCFVFCVKTMSLLGSEPVELEYQ